MKDIVKILAGDAAQEVKSRIQASAKDVAMFLAATLLLVCGFVTFMFAGYVFLLRYMEPVYAALIIGGVFFVTALILLLAIKSRTAHPDRETGETDASSVNEGLAQIEAEARGYVRRHAKQATLMSLLAGVVVGGSPDIRRTLMHALDTALAEHQARGKEKDPPRRKR